MKRIKRHKIKEERVEASSSRFRDQQEHDLAYYIHDRVELMHQVFSVLKPKELKSIAPECVRRLSVDDLQELCLEELLGISSKRLCAILDGAEPPSDTESSSQSPERLETISLDSISSDDDVLSQTSKRSKKHKRNRNSKSKGKKHKRKKSKDDGDNEEPGGEADMSRASRAGLTVLELLELQARARAIRAQLQQDQPPKQVSETVATSSHPASDNDDVEIKEEPAEVVEISSEDEKPKLEPITDHEPSTSKEPENKPQEETSQTITKRINDLIITVPQSKPTRKIKLNRNKCTITVPNVPVNSTGASTNGDNTTRTVTVVTEKAKSPVVKDKKDKKKKAKKKEKKASKDKDSDHDEIMLQLSDSEKMDLLEGFDAKKYDKVSSSEDSESSSSDSSSDEESKDDSAVIEKITINNTEKTDQPTTEPMDSTAIDVQEQNKTSTEEKVQNTPEDKQDKNSSEETQEKENTDLTPVRVETVSETNEPVTEIATTVENVVELSHIEKPLTETAYDNRDIENNQDTIILDADMKSPKNLATEQENVEISDTVDDTVSEKAVNVEVSKENTEGVPNEASIEDEKLSDGELVDQESSDVEAIDLQAEVVCISDDEGKKKKKNKKKEKKDKKAKKEKKSKKSKTDFHEGADQNFYTEGTIVISISNNSLVSTENESLTNDKNSHLKSTTIDTSPVILDQDDRSPSNADEDNDVYEILEISDDSSCYEAEGVSVLSKEPTAEEIIAFSARIDEIKCEDVITDEETREYEQGIQKENIDSHNEEEIYNISWKDRYLGSKKVKRVLSTSNILNALRKKNIELKKKIEESKKILDKEVENVNPAKVKPLEEGTIEHYNMLHGSTKYVNPVPDSVETKDIENGIDSTQETLQENQETPQENKDTSMDLTMREMKKDAKQLLKMYKRLLKYNNMSRQKDPNKKKNKKSKKKKDKLTSTVTAVVPKEKMASVVTLIQNN